MNKKIIGVAGYMGCGKSTLSKYWSEYFGIERLDADLEAKALMNESSALINRVGESFGVVVQGKIDFTELGKIVFADKSKLDLLNSIVHPVLIDHINDRCAGSAILVDAALLTLWGSRVTLDKALWISAKIDTRVKRICDRNGFDVAAARQRVESQMNLFNPPAAESDWLTVQNDGELGTAQYRGVEILNRILNG